MVVVCTVCPIGKYADNQGYTACLTCPAGSSNTVTGSAGCDLCPAGKYSIAGGQCTACAAGTYTSVDGSSVCLACPSGAISAAGSVACSVCAAGTFVASGGQCAACTAGTFAYFQGSTACQACPSGTGSIAGATLCVTCSAVSTCRMPVTQKACPSCTAACLACSAGKYNDGSSTACTNCLAGTYSTAIQAMTQDVCSNCDTGFSTLPTATGVTACSSCASLGQSMPINALQDGSSGDVLLCGWSCSSGYLLVNSSQSNSTILNYTSKGYSTTQALALGHIVGDYCCNPSLTSIGPGLYLQGCNRTYDGDTAACPPVANAQFFYSGLKVNHCSDWKCNSGFFSNGTACVQQPSCRANYTYMRDAAGEIFNSGFGAFTCVPCSTCMDGSTLLKPCNGSIDTQCIMCPSTSFSTNGGPCLSPVPVGSIGVLIRLTSLPPFQGRPSVYADGTPIKWTSINFVAGFFMRSYTKCQSTAAELTYQGGDAPCSRLDTETTACTLPKCKTQCKPWNGTAGWYLVPSTGLCTPCVYETACAATQYSNMDACGPTSPPQCTPCPGALPPNALSWANPGRILTGYPPCDVVCRNGFIRTDNFTCIYCPNLPENAKVTVGCSWVCSLGYLQVGNLCVRCTNEPVSCGVGTYLGYVDGLQCAKCLPCSNAVPNSIFTSAGSNNGPNTCALRCNPGTFIDPTYGLDVFENPIVCAECSVPQCVSGQSFLVGCTPQSDAYCAPCSDCPIGYDVRLPCTIGADTVCLACDASLLPANAVWTAAGCEQWECMDMFYPSTDNTHCIPCKQPNNCTKNDRFDYISAGCGVCTPCDPALLRPWQCFNGDGQCGTTYKCGFVTTQAPTTSTTAKPTTTARPPTTSPPTTPPPLTSSYATLMTVTLPKNITLANLLKSVRCPSNPCTVQIVSVTQNSSTTLCAGKACRRLMDSAADLMTVEIVFLSPQPLVPTIDGAAIKPVSISTTNSYLVSDVAVLGDVAQLTTFIKIEKEKDDAPLPLLLMWCVGGVCAFLFVLVIIAVAGAKVENEPAPTGVQAQFNWDGVRISASALLE